MMIRKIALLLVALAVIGASAIPAAGAGTGGDGVAVAAAKKCKKKKGASKSAKKKKKCKKKKAGSSPSSPGLPGTPLSPTPSSPPEEPPPPAEATVDAVTVDDDPVLGGTNTTGQVTISDPAPTGGKTVNLQSSFPTRIAVPPSVQVAAGQDTAGFPVTTTDGPTVTATITANIGPSSRDVQLTAVDDPGVASVTLAYKCFPGVGLVNVGGNSVTLNVPAPANTTVDLFSSAPSALSVPASVTVPTGASAAFFDVDTHQVTPSVTVTATLDTSAANDTARVRDGSSPTPVLESLTLTPDEVILGDTTSGIVELDCEAGPGGLTVTLATDNGDVVLPASVLVPQDEVTATFPIGLTPTAAAGTATISGTLGGTAQDLLTIIDLDT
jgi:hypothetical protein